MAKNTSDILAEFPGITIIHQKIPSHEVGRHEHQEHEFFLPLQGEITIQYGTTVVKAGPGKMLYVPPNLDHSFTSTSQGSGERVIWLIDDKIFRKHTLSQFAVTSLHSNTLAKELIFYLLIHQKAEGVKYFISALVETLIDSLQASQVDLNVLSANHIEGKVTDIRTKKAIQLMDENLAEISIAKVASESGLSLRNFNRLFLKEVGMTPKYYLILRRMDKAKELLKKTQMTITDISLEVGYGSLSKFIETFKKTEGQLPSDYRNTTFL
jgi:AraC-like DNA-binding protein